MIENNKNKNADKALHKTLCDSACDLFNKMRPSFGHSVEQMEERLSEFTIEEQKWIISWAGEVADDSYVAQFMVSKNEREEEMMDIVKWLASLIKEYEDEIRIKYIYEQNLKN